MSTLPDYLADGDHPDGWTPDELTAPVDRPLYDPAAEIVLPARFRVDNDSAAAWAMRKLRAIRMRQESNRMIAEDEIDRVKSWLDDVNTPMERDASYFESILRDYALRCRENPDDGRKTISLPAGKVTTRIGSPRWTVDDETFLTWARANHPDLIRVKEQPALDEMKSALIVAESGGAAVTEDGEVVPGVAVSAAELSVTVKTDL